MHEPEDELGDADRLLVAVALDGRSDRRLLAAVDGDDVLAMHDFLRDFDGDFQALFRGTGREPDADAA